MKENKTLQSQALAYSSLATAILGAQALDAQVVWTDIADTTLMTNGAEFGINLDNDTVFGVDFRITQLVDSGQFRITGVILSGNSTNQNQAQGINVGNYNYPFRLNVGDSIGPKELFRGINTAKNIGYLAFEVDGSTYPSSQFVDTVNGVSDAFLGVRFRGRQNDTDKVFFGWIRLDVAADLKSVTIKDFGYQPQGSTALTAGENSPIGLQEFKAPQLQLQQRGLELHLIQMGKAPQNGKLEFYDLTGRFVRSVEVEADQKVLSLEHFSPGMYLVKWSVQGEELSKKIVVTAY